MEETILKSVPLLTRSFLRNLLDWRETGQMGKMIGQLMQGFFGPGGMTESNMKRVFVEYHDNLRKIVSKERLLEYRVQDGYRPLCDFLGVPVPTMMVDEKEVEESFPRVNDGSAFLDRFVVIDRLQTQRIIKKAGTFVGVALVGAGLWYLQMLSR
jgi:Sulfotransferase domain